MVHGQDPAAMLEAGLDMLGGIERLEPRGKRVLVKPNVVNDRPPPATTSPPVIAAVVRKVRAAGAAEVIVADSSGIIRFPTAANLEATGVRAAAESAGARVLALEDEPWVRVEPAAATSLPRYYVSKPVYQADLFINLPVVKTHRFTHYSCSLKNLVGIVHPRYRPSVSFLAGDWHERIAELLPALDVALVPAINPYASPLKLFEYMAAGLPSIAPDQPNLREVLEHERNALLVKPNDAPSLEAALAQLVQDRNLRERLGARARSDVIERDLTWIGNARRVVAAAEEVLAERRRKR